MPKTFYVFYDGKFFDRISPIMGHETKEAALAEYRKFHKDTLLAMSLSITEQAPKDPLPPVAPFAVFVTVKPTAKNLLKADYRTREGTYLTLARARVAVAEDLIRCGETFGGLIESLGTTNRVYEIFEATGWTAHSVTP